jgi:hypothetical protein
MTPETRTYIRASSCGRQVWMVGAYRRGLANPAAHVGPFHRSDSASAPTPELSIRSTDLGETSTDLGETSTGSGEIM